MTSAAIYARVSSARQKKDQTIGSPTAALRGHARQLGADLPGSGCSRTRGTRARRWSARPGGAARPGRPGVRGRGAVLLPGPARPQVRLPGAADRGVRPRGCGEFVKGPRGDTPEDQLMAQFQGMFAEYEKAQLAEYEKAQLMERYRRGKAHRQAAGRSTSWAAPRSATATSTRPPAAGRLQIAGHEAAIAAELFRRYTDDGASFTRPARPSRSSTATHQPRESTLPCSRRTARSMVRASGKRAQTPKRRVGNGP